MRATDESCVAARPATGGALDEPARPIGGAPALWRSSTGGSLGAAGEREPSGAVLCVDGVVGAVRGGAEGAAVRSTVLGDEVTLVGGTVWPPERGGTVGDCERPGADRGVLLASQAPHAASA